MRLSKRTRYGIRLILELAANYGKKSMTLNEIAKKQDISMKYLSLIIIPLKSAGLVIASRGAHGGYRLAKSPAEITAADIVNLLEGEVVPVECLANPSFCTRSTFCASQVLWERFSQTVSAFFASVTIEDLLKEMREKQKHANFAYQI
jgi:Rrf2 family protein